MRGRYTIVAATLSSEEVATRIPFRYGIATMTRLPHVFLSIELEGPQGRARGLAADHLPPKWFTKDPAAALADEILTMRAVIVRAAAAARGSSFDRLFEWWRELYAAQDAWAKSRGYPPLLAHFGTSLVERAVIDAFCRLEGLTFAEAVRANHLGLDLRALDRTLPENWRGLLPAQPLAEVVARHTVGLLDAIHESDLTAETRVEDGLPQSLEAAVRTYRLCEFKIKFCGQWATDTTRLEGIFACLAANAPAGWRYTLDGNESFADAATFREYWTRLTEQPWLQPHLGRLLFIEQPVGRAAALRPGADWRSWAGAPPIIIDESDGSLSDVPLALSLGYAGSSHKNCKGVIKGILNRCRIAFAAGRPSGPPLLMSGEDLSNIGPVALLQDLAVQAVLGNASVERNGHHYFRGLTMWPAAVQAAMRQAHPDLYTNERGFSALKITNGRLQLGSVLQAPFGYAAALDPGPFCTTHEEIR